MQTFQHIILGTGQATGTLLGKLIPTNESIAVIEGAKIGGSCVNYGCTPTKSLVASAKAIFVAKRGNYFGFQTGPLRVDYDRIRERMNGIRNGSSSGLESWMENTPNVTLIRDWGAFSGPRTIQVGDQTLHGEQIYVNVGTHPFLPPIEGLKEVAWMDSARLLDLERIPEHLLIIGGGYIGVEFAQIYRRFGAEVTILQRGAQLMPREDRDVADAIADFLREEGIDIRFNTQVVRAKENEAGVELTLSSAGTESSVTGSHLLVATGRRPNTKGIGLEHADIATDERGFIQVDDFCQTSAPGVFALGDVNGHGAFTHTSVNDAEIVLDHLYGGNRKISSRIPIYGLFTDPPLGRVGMTEKEAVATGRKILKATRLMSRISRAKEMGETNGFAKILIDAETDLVLGVSILGPGGDEIINMFAAIMHSGIPCRSYREVVLVHPTVSELMPWVLDSLQPIS